ncbi:MAG: WD40 repeat domain-containing protein [Prevotellaceae bacterium]|jgi:hypothetical protein|nr:WD40 repeat domain-containing protein [Prevotellaceae bacterium]
MKRETANSGRQTVDGKRRSPFILHCLLLLLHCPLFIIPAQAQYYSVGTEPSAVQWRQIRTDRFTVIYPQGTDSLAQRYAWLFDRSYRYISEPLRTGLSRLPVVLHPYNLNSNGVVVWAPKRMELMTTPATSGYAQMWDRQLVAHETRHVAQMNKLHSGVFKYLSFIIGEQAEGAAAGIYLAGWFLEGDAVVSETAVSHTGRGRQPEFLMPVKAYQYSGTKFSWDTWNLGSYRYNVPNEYQMGYLLAAYAYRHSGKYLFGNMMDYITQYPLRIPPPMRGLKKYGGMSEQAFFRQALAYQTAQWMREDSARTVDRHIQQLAFPEKETYRSYRSVLAADTRSVIALRTDMSKPHRLVSVDSSGKEHVLKYVGQINSAIKKQGDKLYWTATVPHERWEQVSYSILQSCDLTTKKVTSLTHRTRYFSPAPSPDGDWVAVVENNAKGENFLTILDLYNYQPPQRFALPPGQVLKELAWRQDAKVIYCTALTDEGIGIWQFNVKQKKWEQLLPHGVAGINRPAVYGDFILFESGYDGVNNIYALHTRSHKVYQVTHALFGAFDPAVSADSTALLFSNYISAGYTIASMPLDEKAWEETTFTAPKRFELADAVTLQAGFNIDTLQVPSPPVYESKRYSKWAHLFRIHSWAPFYYDPDELRSAAFDKDILQYIGWGATALSQNTLGTLVSRMGYKYGNGFHSGHLRFTYRGWYPVVDFSLHVNDRHRQVHKLDTLPANNGYLYDFIFNTNLPSVNGYLRFYIPWRFTGGVWHTSLTPQAEYHFTNDEYRAFSFREKTDYRYFHIARLGFTLSSQWALATRDIFPRWGFSLRALYSFPVTSRNIFRAVTSLQASCYLPGVMANHGLLLAAGYQWQNESAGFYQYSINGVLKYPRGYTTGAPQRLMNATVDYTFPVWYPDINLRWLFYFKRVRMTVFGDFAQAQANSVTQNYISAGADLLVDFHALRFGFPVSAGVRYAQPLLHDTAPSFNLLLNISL